MAPWAVWCLVYGGAGLVLAPFTALKGKWGMFLLGFLSPLAWILGGLKLAEPSSWWPKRLYDQAKFQEAKERYAWRPS